MAELDAHFRHVLNALSSQLNLRKVRRESSKSRSLHLQSQALSCRDGHTLNGDDGVLHNDRFSTHKHSEVDVHHVDSDGLHESRK